MLQLIKKKHKVKRAPKETKATKTCSTETFKAYTDYVQRVRKK